MQSRMGKLSSEVWGGVLLLLSLFLTIFLVGAGGELGVSLRDALTYLLGQWSPLGPLALLGMGLVLVLGRADISKRRLFFAVGLFFVSTMGLFHLLTGAQPLAEGAEVVRSRGGAIGALVAFPLQRAMGSAATFALLAVGVTTAVLLATRTSLKDFLLAMGDLLTLARQSLRARRTVTHTRYPGMPGEAASSSPGIPVESAAAAAKGRTRRRWWKKRSVSEGPWPIAPVIQVPETEAQPVVEPSVPVLEAESLLESEPQVEEDLAEPEADPAPTTENPPVGRPRLQVVREPPVDEPTRPGPGGKPAADVHSKPPRAEVDDQPDPYRLPPARLLSRGGNTGGDNDGLNRTAASLRQALADHGVDARITGVVSGPSVTRFEIELAPGVKVQKLSALSNDIAYALATPDVRMLVPIPGRSAIGIEVPNTRRQIVRLGDILSSSRAKAARHPLVVGLGMDIAGKPALLNLAELPHVLIAGATGAGKSSCINSIITSLLMRTRPEDLRLILVDPKRVELSQYQGVPHLLTRVITDPKKAAEGLKWVVAEMDRRYDLLAEAQVRDISGYAAKWGEGQLDRDRFDRFPYLVVVVDELNDLMMVAGREVEMAIVRIAQMARAVGIHLVLATQRPSVNVITGVIKANVPSRLAFSVASQTDSRVIIDSVGAEKLVGRGDMLVVTARQPRPQRVQGAWVEESEISAVVSWITGQGVSPQVLDEALDEVLTVKATAEDPQDDEDEELLKRAMELVVRSQLGSTSMLQRKLRVGFARAGRLMDILERRGVVGPSQGSKAREVLIGPDEM